MFNKILKEVYLKRFLSTLIFLLPIFLFSQETISLDYAIQLARENNLTLQSSYFQKESARWSYQNSITQYMPKVNFVYTGVYLDKGLEPFPGVVLQDKQNHVTNLQVEQILFAGGRLYNANQISKILYQIEENNYLKMIVDTEVRVTDLYYMILQTLSTIDILTLHLSLCQDLKTNTEILYQNGIGLETDIMQWDLRIIEIENQRDNVWNSFLSLEQAWAQTIGIQNIYDIPLPESVPIESFLIEIHDFANLEKPIKNERMNDFLTRVHSSNIDLKNIDRTLEAAKYSRNISKADFLPSAFLSFNYELSNDSAIDKIQFLRDPAWQLVANVSFPIFHGFRNSTSDRSNAYQLQAQARILNETKRGIEITARQAWFNFDSAVSFVIQNEKHYHLAERSLAIIRNLYQQGMTTNIALTDAQNAALVSNIQYINSIYEYISVKNKLNSF